MGFFDSSDGLSFEEEPNPNAAFILLAALHVSDFCGEDGEEDEDVCNDRESDLSALGEQGNAFLTEDLQAPTKISYAVSRSSESERLQPRSPNGDGRSEMGAMELKTSLLGLPTPAFLKSSTISGDGKIGFF